MYLILPSAPVSSTITFTFFAKSFRLSSEAAACEKPSVSPQPPIATMIAVPFVNLERTSDIFVKKGKDDGEAWLNVEDCMNASAT